MSVCLPTLNAIALHLEVRCSTYVAPASATLSFASDSTHCDAGGDFPTSIPVGADLASSLAWQTRAGRSASDTSGQHFPRRYPYAILSSRTHVHRKANPTSMTHSTLTVQHRGPAEERCDSRKRGQMWQMWQMCGRFKSRNCHGPQSWFVSHLALAVAGVADVAGFLKNFPGRKKYRIN